MKSDDFPRSSFEAIFVVTAFSLAFGTGVASSLTQAATFSVLAYLEEDILHLEKHQEWRRLKFTSKSSFCALHFSHELAQVITPIQCDTRTKEQIRIKMVYEVQKTLHII